ncbi:MAG: DUF4363 family protein [Clostridia bacterium]|nr:DUF4363 family protein [Clostridia bacterium]
MKAFFTAAGIFLLIIILIVISYIYTNKSTNDLLALLEENEKFVAKNDWENAKIAMEKFNKLWEQKKEFFNTLINHSTSDTLEICISKMNFAVKNHSSTDFLREKNIAGLLLSCFKDMQKVTISNIL